MNRWDVAVSGGEVPVIADEATGGTVVILAHGAGSHMEHKTMEWLSGIVREAGASVARFNFLYKALGKSVPDRPPVCIATYRAVVDSVCERMSPDRLIIGGHSFGGRMASMLEAERKTVDGLILFGYPLHPPGRLEKLRDAHLPQIKTPTLQMNGTEDEFCSREKMDEVLSRLDPKIWQMKWVEGADHSYSVKKSSGRTKKDAEIEIGMAVKGFLEMLGKSPR